MACHLSPRQRDRHVLLSSGCRATRLGFSVLQIAQPHFPQLLLLTLVLYTQQTAGTTSQPPTLSLSIASSLPGANMMRSWRLATEAARLDRADREEEGLMPAIALVTVERLSWRWLSSVPIVPLLFSKSDTSTGGEGEGWARGKTHGQEEGRERERRQRREKLLEKKKRVARRKAEIKIKRQSIGRADQQQCPGATVRSSSGPVWEPFLGCWGCFLMTRCLNHLAQAHVESCPTAPDELGWERGEFGESKESQEPPP